MNQTVPHEAEKMRHSIRVSGALFILKVSRLIRKVLSKVNHLIDQKGNAVALGLLNADRIDQLVRHSYTSQPDYYNPGQYDYTWEEEIIEPLRKRIPKNDLLVAFCGKGRESEIFARHGFKVTGIDREPFMIEGAKSNAKTKGFEAAFECVDFNHYTSTSPYSIVYTSTWMYTTYPTKEARREFLDKCKELCRPEGLIVISYRVRSDDFKDSVMHFITKAVGLITFGNKAAQKGDRLENGLFWHYFTEPEIESEIEAAGMKTVYHKPSENGRLEWRFLVPTHVESSGLDG